jgi:hypothetical protein
VVREEEWERGLYVLVFSETYRKTGGNKEWVHNYKQEGGKTVRKEEVEKVT